MTVALDGFAIVRAVGENPSVFADARAQVQKAALAIVGAQLKGKMLNLQKVSEVRQTLGAATFELLLDHLPDKQVATITKKLDPNNLDQKVANGAWHRNHIDALASGAAEPAPKAVKAPAKKKGAAPKKKSRSRRITEENFYPTSMAEAVGSRKKH